MKNLNFHVEIWNPQIGDFWNFFGNWNIFDEK